MNDPHPIAPPGPRIEPAAGEQTLELSIAGMTCAACSTRIEKVLNRLPGVTASVNLATERARIRYAPADVTPQVLIGAVERSGYGATVAAAADFTADRARRADEYARLRRLFWIAAALTLPLVAQMGWMLGGQHSDVLPRWFQLLLATPVQFWIGRRFYAGAWHALRGGGANMDVLVALGTSAAYLFSAAVTLLGLQGQHVYFEAGAAVITLVLMGKLLEARAKVRTSAAIEQLLRLRPRYARIERAGGVEEVEVSQSPAQETCSTCGQASGCRWTARCWREARRWTKACSRVRACRWRKARVPGCSRVPRTSRAGCAVARRAWAALPSSPKSCGWWARPRAPRRRSSVWPTASAGGSFPLSWSWH